MNIHTFRTLALATAVALNCYSLCATAVDERYDVDPIREFVEDPTTERTILAPQYGGTIRYGADGFPRTTDVWFERGSDNIVNGVNESLAIGDWAIHRDKFAFKSSVTPPSVMTGQLAEGWEHVDPTTVVFKIRQRVFWHDKPPVNGRQLTANDIAYNWNRYLGLQQFAEQGPSRSLAGAMSSIYESVTATDDFTVEFRLAEPRLDPLFDILRFNRPIYAREVIQEYGDAQDWRNNVGTGPFDLVEWNEDEVIVWRRVEGYWGFDEKFLGNRLPYVDEVRATLMDDPALRIAAIRAGVLDHLGSAGNSQIRDLNESTGLLVTNPELLSFQRINPCTTCIGFNLTAEPFSNIDVRRAMQMALDLEAMNNELFDGQGDWEPDGLVGKGSLPGYFTPFRDWPEEIAQYYRYDAERAELILDAAGYPRGVDGLRFRTRYNVSADGPLDFFERQVAYWSEIGVLVELRLHDSVNYASLIQSTSYEGMLGLASAYSTGDPFGLLRALKQGAIWNSAGVNDAELNAMLDAAARSTEFEEHRRLVREAVLYIAASHWNLWSLRLPEVSVFQPWIIGHSGEVQIGPGNDGLPMFARLWIDEEQRTDNPRRRTIRVYSNPDGAEFRVQGYYTHRSITTDHHMVLPIGIYSYDVQKNTYKTITGHELDLSIMPRGIVRCTLKEEGELADATPCNPS